jgi:cell wall-associated NlpC family hydrolase
MASANDIVTYAQMELGKPYVYGDEGPATFDCSGLIYWIYGKAGIKVPRTAHEQQAWAKPVSSPAPGDLVFFGSPAYHVGLYIGGGKMIDAPGTNLHVRVDTIGHPTSYGRVPGIGGGVLTPVTDAAGNIVDWVADKTGVGDWVEKLLGGGKAIVITGSFVALGLVLVGLGIYKTVMPTVRKVGGELL